MSASEENLKSTDNARRVILIVVALGAVLLVAGIIWLKRQPAATGTGGPTDRKLEGAFRPGDPQFEQLMKLISLDDPIADEMDTAVGGKLMVLQTTVRNFTGRTIVGLEMRAVVVDLQNKPVKERTVVIIPDREPYLEHNKTLKVPIRIEGFKKEDVRANIQMQITGLKVQ